MDKGDLRKLAAMLKGVGDLHGRDITPALVDLWFTVLAGYELEEIRGALNAHVADTERGQFMPKPNEIIRLLRGGTEERALIAWTQLETAIQRHGPYVPIQFDDARIQAVVEEMGGLSRFTGAVSKDWPFIATEFRKRYAAHRVEPNVRPAPMLGAGNAWHGAGDPVRIGKPAAPALPGPEQRPALTLVPGEENER